jgi:hypothetical protein
MAALMMFSSGDDNHSPCDNLNGRFHLSFILKLLQDDDAIFGGTRPDGHGFG